jgi:hypothetical protein
MMKDNGRTFYTEVDIDVFVQPLIQGRGRDTDSLDLNVAQESFKPRTIIAQEPRAKRHWISETNDDVVS